MDYIEGLAKQASQLTMYDVKSYYNQARNVVLNVSEMEAKVREATNDDPWGASSTLMQQIADATNNYAQFNEVMPTIYSRFMEKEAREWRQIYKALTLLEFLVKSGSERVVDDARAHVSTIKMLRSFHYIDEKGKDQGINVRNRASEIASMLGDVEKIRQERRKAKSNKAKYQGQGNDGGMSFVTSGGSRYGGFGSESVGGGGGGGDYEGDDDFRSSSRGFHDRTESGAEYDEYEGADDFDEQPRRSASRSTSRTAPKPQPPSKAASKVEKPVEKPKEVNLFDFDDDPAPAPAASAPTGPIGGDDEFDDFQQAPSLQPVASPAAKPAPSGNAGLFDLLGSTSTTSVPSQPAQNQNRVPALSSPVRATPTTAAPNFSSMMSPPPLPKPTNPSRPSYSSTTSTPAVYSKPAGASTFDDLWMTSLTSLGTGAKSNGAPEAARAGKKTIKDLEKEKATSTLWGPASSGGGARVGQGQEPAKPSIGGGSGGGGGDDLLL